MKLVLNSLVERTEMSTSFLWHIENREPLLQEIGKVTVRWAALDLILVNILEVALKNRAAAHQIILGSNNAGAQRLDAFKDAIGASYFEQFERKKVIETANKAKSLLAIRNSIVHSPLIMSFSLKGTAIKMEPKAVSKKGTIREMEKIDVHLARILQVLEDMEESYDYLDAKYGDPIDSEE